MPFRNLIKSFFLSNPRPKTTAEFVCQRKTLRLLKKSSISWTNLCISKPVFCPKTNTNLHLLGTFVYNVSPINQSYPGLPCTEIFDTLSPTHLINALPIATSRNSLVSNLKATEFMKIYNELLSFTPAEIIHFLSNPTSKLLKRCISILPSQYISEISSSGFLPGYDIINILSYAQSRDCRIHSLPPPNLSPSKLPPLHPHHQIVTNKRLNRALLASFRKCGGLGFSVNLKYMLETHPTPTLLNTISSVFSSDDYVRNMTIVRNISERYYEEIVSRVASSMISEMKKCVLDIHEREKGRERYTVVNPRTVIVIVPRQQISSIIEQWK